MRELKRVIVSWQTLGSLAILVFICCLQFVTNDLPYTHQYSSKKYVEAYTNIINEGKILSVDEFSQYIGEIYLEAEHTLNLYKWCNFTDSEKELFRDRYEELCGSEQLYEAENGNLKVTEEQYSSAILSSEVIQVIKSQINEHNDYIEYYESIKKNALQLEMFALFSDSESFSSRNTQKTVKDFAVLENVEMTIDNELAVNAFFSNTVADYCLFVFMLISVMTLIYERRRGIWDIIYASRCGRGRLAVTRIFVILICAVAGTLVIIGGKLLLAWGALGGFGDLNRAVQSNSLFHNVPEAITMGEMLINYFVYKVIGMWIIGVIIWLLFLAVANIGGAIAISAAFVALEFVLFTSIPDSYSIVVLRFANIFAFIDYSRVFTNYLNIELFGVLIRGFNVTLAVIPLQLVICSCGCALVHCYKRPIASPTIINRIQDVAQKAYSLIVRNIGIYAKELYKVLVYQKGLIIILLICSWGIWIAQAPYTEGEYNAFASNCHREIEGVADENLLQSVTYEVNKLASEEYFSQYQLMKLLALTEAQEKIEELICLSDQDCIAYWFTDDSLYDALTSSDADSVGVIAVLFLVLLLADVVSYENHQKTRSILRCSRNGLGKVWRAKILSAVLMTVIIWVGVYGTQLFKATEVYGGLHALSAPTRSLEIFTFIPDGISIGVFLVLMYGVRLLILLSLTGGIMLISSLVKRPRVSVVISIVVFVIPCVISMIMGTNKVSISFVDALSCGMYKDGGWQTMVSPCVMLLFGGLSWLLAALHWRERHRL